MKYHWKIIFPIIHLKFNDYLLKYFHWHLSDIGLSLLYISYISLKFQRSFQTVQKQTFETFLIPDFVAEYIVRKRPAFTKTSVKDPHLD